MKHLFVILAAVLFAAAPLKAQIDNQTSGLINPATTYTLDVDMSGPYDSLDVLFEHADSCSGRLKATALVYIDGNVIATNDTLNLGNFTALAAGTVRVCTDSIRNLGGGAWSAFPAYVRITAITNGNATSSGSKATTAVQAGSTKRCALKVRKHRRV